MFCVLCNSKDTHLAGVLASLQVSSTEHGLSDHARVGVVTVLISQNRDIQTLQFVAISSCGDIEPGTKRQMKDGTILKSELQKCGDSMESD